MPSVNYGTWGALSALEARQFPEILTSETSLNRGLNDAFVCKIYALRNYTVIYNNLRKLMTDYRFSLDATKFLE